jgi:uncharacterized protein YodC (DUF2158 family)
MTARKTNGRKPAAAKAEPPIKQKAGNTTLGAAGNRPKTCADRVAEQEEVLPSGSVVCLMSGGTTMTVVGHCPGWVDVAWSYSGDIKASSFPFVCLCPAPPTDDAIPF